MVTIKTFFHLASSVAALAVQKRDFSSVISCLRELDDKINQFNTLMAGYQGGLTYAINIWNTEKELDSLAIQCATEAQALGGRITTEQYPQLSGVVDKMAPDLKASLETTENKKGFFALDNVLGIFRPALGKFAGDGETLAEALGNIVPSEYEDDANMRKDQIKMAFDQCIAVYN